MKINCVHGYITFEEVRPGEVSDFMSLFGVELVRVGSVFTFADLEDAPDYSIAGMSIVSPTAIATESFEGPPGEVFRVNGLVYNFDKGLVLPIAAITNTARIETGNGYFLSAGLIMPGSIMEGGRVKDYAAWFTTDTMKFKYSEVDIG